MISGWRVYHTHPTSKAVVRRSNPIPFHTQSQSKLLRFSVRSMVRFPGLRSHESPVDDLEAPSYAARRWAVTLSGDRSRPGKTGDDAGSLQQMVLVDDNFWAGSILRSSLRLPCDSYESMSYGSSHPGSWSELVSGQSAAARTAPLHLDSTYPESSSTVPSHPHFTKYLGAGVLFHTSLQMRGIDWQR